MTAKEADFWAGLGSAPACSSAAGMQPGLPHAAGGTAPAAVGWKLEDAQIPGRNNAACPWVSLPESPRGIFKQFTPKMSLTMLELEAVFSLSCAEQLPVTVRGETIVTSVVQTW